MLVRTLTLCQLKSLCFLKDLFWKPHLADFIYTQWLFAEAVGLFLFSRHASGADHLHMCVHRRIPVALRDRAADPGAGQVSHRHAQHHRQPARLPRFREAV